MPAEFRSINPIKFSKNLKSFYEKALQKRDLEVISFYRSKDSVEDLDTLVKRSLATQIFQKQIISKSKLKNIEKKMGTSIQELELTETWVIRDDDFNKILKDVFPEDTNFYFHLLTGALPLFTRLKSELQGVDLEKQTCKTSTAELKSSYYRPTKYLFSLLEENKMLNQVSLNVVQDGIYWNYAFYLLWKLLFKCSVCHGLSCKEENLPYLIDELDHMFSFPCSEAVESIFSALDLAQLVLVENRKVRASEKAKNTISDLFNPLTKAVNIANIILSDVISRYENERETLKTVLKSHALNYNLFKDMLLERIKELKKAEKITEVEELLLQIHSIKTISHELEKYNELENLKSKFLEHLPEDYYELLKLCENERDIKTFAHCWHMMEDLFKFKKLSGNFFTSLKIFLSLLNEFSFQISSNPLSVRSTADKFATIERKCRNRIFDDSYEKELFSRFTEEKICKLHKEFNHSMTKKYHYSIVHITPTIASSLGIEYKTDRSLYHKPIKQNISDTIDTGRPFKNAILIFIDGLGLKQYQYFNSVIEPKQNTLRLLAHEGFLLPLKSVFPTETFCCLYSIYNALKPEEHNVIGKHYMMQEGPKLIEVNIKENVNHLKSEPNNFFKACAANNYKIGFFSQTEDETGFVKNIFLKDVPSKLKQLVYKPRLGELFESAATYISNCLKQKQNFVVQIYIDEADYKWHDDGPFNKRIVEEINDKLRIFLRLLKKLELPPTLIAIFSDHGLVYTSGSYIRPKTITYEDLGEEGKILESGLRLGYAYFEPTSRRNIKNFANKIREELCEDCKIIIKNQSKWRGHETFPDIMIYPCRNDIFILRETKDPLSIVYQHQGAHGACSFDEMFVPLILFSTHKLQDMKI